MFSPKLAAVWLLVLGVASAAPSDDDADVAVTTASEQAAAMTGTSLEPWVTVYKDGEFATVTPYLTTVSGTPTVVDAVPHALTATVYTTTRKDGVTETVTMTGDIPGPTLNPAEGGAGAFIAYNNTEGDYAPFCTPTNLKTLYTGQQYYVTWDPTYFNATNTTVKLNGFYEGDSPHHGHAFASEEMSADWGFYQWDVSHDLLNVKGEDVDAVNITVQLVALPEGGKAVWLVGPKVQVMKKPKAAPSKRPQAQGAELWVGLGSIVIFCLVVIICMCVANRRLRRIGLGNVMSRTRHGYGLTKSGRSSRRRRNRFGKNDGEDKEQTVALMERRNSNDWRY